MGRRNYDVLYNDIPIFDHIRQSLRAQATDSNKQFHENDRYVFVMGPYTAFDATYDYDDADQLTTPFIEDPLFDPNKHGNTPGRSDYEAALADLCDDIEARFDVHAFLATDITSIPTVEESGSTEPGMSVLDQSIAFTTVSDAAVFVLTNAGIIAGAALELGAIFGEFNLRRANMEQEHKPRERLGIFATDDFSSASVDEIPYTYGIAVRDFSSREALLDGIEDLLANIERTENEGPLPIHQAL
jgi:hypothetical protein